MRSVAVPTLWAHVALAALNHVLRQQDWARDRLRAHVGRSVCIIMLVPGLRTQVCALITPDAQLQPALIEHPTVTLTVRPTLDAAFAFMQQGTRGIAGVLKLEGDVLLAAALGELAQHLRWDIEEDLSHWVGDIAAHQAGQWVRAAARRRSDWMQRVVSGARAWSVTEAQLLVDRNALQSLRQELAHLEQRVRRCEGQPPTGSARPRALS